MAIAHNAKAFDLHFILNRAIMLKSKPELITNGLKVINMKMEHLVFLDSVSFLRCALLKLPEASACRPLYNFFITILKRGKTSIIYVLCLTYGIMGWMR